MSAHVKKLGAPWRARVSARIRKLSRSAYLAVGVLACVTAIAQTSAGNARSFLLYLVCANVAVLSSRLVGGSSLVRAGFLILLLAMDDLTLPELLFVAASVALLGELKKERGRPAPPAMIFSVASVSIGVLSAQYVYRAAAHVNYGPLFPFPIIASSFVLLFNYTLSRALWSAGEAPLGRFYRKSARPLLSWFIALAYMAYLIRAGSLQSGVHAALLALPVIYALDRGYRKWSDATEQHAAELTLLHRRTLETLSVVINARDHSASQNLRRVQSFAQAIGKEMGLTERDLEDLHVATLVYNIGQLGVPDHILLKPGTLTLEEWEKVKTHPITGSEMLSRMNFPPGVRAIVQAHHEKWNGTGYPAGLKGAAIPIGARVLAAVDCLDALASDRPFRAALPIREAMEIVSAESGRSFDPVVVSILERCYEELERKAWETAKRTSPDALQVSGSERDLGHLAAHLLVEDNSIVESIVSARQETQLLRVLAGDVAQTLRLDAIAAAAHKCLVEIVPFDTLVLYVRRGDEMRPACVLGKSRQRFSRSPVPVGTDLSGRAMRDRSPVLNGDPRQELSYLHDDAFLHPLQSALAMPLEVREGAVGTVTLYHTVREAFTRDHLRFLKAASVHVALAVDGALKYEDAENLAGTDHLTGIGNARSLAMHLDRELSRASRDNSSIGVLMCDLNGFKQVNDRFGHLKGNEVLQHVARGLQETCRGSDYFARMGGDEFVVVVPGLKEDLCQSYVSRLEGVAVAAGRAVCGEPCLSISIGIAIYPVDGHDSDSVLRVADQRMYQAKEQHKSSVSPGALQ